MNVQYFFIKSYSFLYFNIKKLYNYELYFCELDIKYFYKQRSTYIRMKMLINYKRRVIILYLFII